MSLPPLAIVLKGYPRLSETFIAHEIRSLESSFDVTIYSLRLPTDTQIHDVHREIEANVVYLPEYLYQQPWRVLRALLKTRRRIFRSGLLKVFWKDFLRDRTANRIRRLGQALVLAAELPDEIQKVYAHFAHTPASVARYACMIRGIPWACSAHAKDIWTSPKWELTEKLDDCRWLTTCTSANTDYLKSLARHPEKVWLNYHGLDLTRFQGSAQYSNRDGTQPGQDVIIISVGRAVEKKGYHHLLAALAKLPKNLNWTFTHIGGGPLLKSLKESADNLGIASKLNWLGPKPQKTVLDHYQSADFFVLNSLIEENGDRDGLPNVIVEAQSQGLAVLSTNISGIPELIQHDHNGWLVEPEDTEALATKLLALITHPEERQRLGKAGRSIVKADFDSHNNHQDISKLLLDL